MERATKRTFVFNLDWADILSEQSPEVRLSVYDAVMAYAATGELVAMDGVPAMAFAFIRREMDRMGRQYDATCEQNRRNGMKGGAPKGNANAKKQPAEAVDSDEKNNRNNRTVEKTTENNRKQPKTTDDNGSVEKTTETTLYDSDDDNDNNKKKISLRDIKEKESSHTGLEEKKAVGLLQGFGDIVDILKGDAAWQETVAMSNHIDVSTVAGQIDAFALHCRASGEEHVTLPSARRHFNGWIKRQIKPTSNEDYDDKLARRRGTEPIARSAEDYTGTL